MSSQAEKIFKRRDLEKFFPSYEKREEQIFLSKTVEQAFQNSEILVAEAGTGIGKSFAYLLPAILFALENKTKVVISTETIALQNQLVNKDIHIISKILNKDIKTKIALGASNYVCKRKLAHLIENGNFDPEMKPHLREFYEWEKTTETGIKLEYTGFASSDFWSKVTREADNCLGKKCINFDKSFYFLEKKKWEDAHILIVNHHLLATHIAGDFKVLPEFKYIVIDEAHNFPEILSSSFKLSLEYSELEELLNFIYQSEKRPGLIGRLNTGKETQKLKNLVKECTTNAIEYFNRLISEVGLIFNAQRVTKSLRLDDGILEKSLSKLLEKLNLFLEELVLDSKDILKNELQLDLERTTTKLAQYIEILYLFRTQESLDKVYWVEPANTFSSNSFYKLNIQELKTEDLLNKYFFPKMNSIIFTSATLSSEKNNFLYFLNSIGNPKCKTLQLDSPFAYEKHALLYLPKKNSFRDPGESPEGFNEDVSTILPKLVEITEGNAFVLFTSIKMLKEVYENVKEKISYPIFSQQELGAEKAKIEFLNTKNSVLFGVSTFWQGIDIPGDKLLSVIITKLPFQPPSDPVLEAKMETLKKSGKNPFLEIQLPQAIVTLKQGFGRLIRSSTDVGIVSILDPRIKTKFYGKKVLDSLPPAKQVHSFLELKKEFNSIKNLFIIK